MADGDDFDTDEPAEDSGVRGAGRLIAVGGGRGGVGKSGIAESLAVYFAPLRQAAVPPPPAAGLAPLPAAHDAIDTPMALRASRKSRWLSRLRALPAEYIVIDVGPGQGPNAVDLMLAANLAVVVTVPEPPAIETTYRFIRAAFV